MEARPFSVVEPASESLADVAKQDAIADWVGRVEPATALQQLSTRVAGMQAREIAPYLRRYLAQIQALRGPGEW